MIADAQKEIENLLDVIESPVSLDRLYRYCSCKNESEKRKMRRLVKQIRKFPVGSSHDGIFKCRTKADLELANAEDLSRIMALRNNIKQREYAFANEHTDYIVRQVSDIVKNWTVMPNDCFKQVGAK